MGPSDKYILNDQGKPVPEPDLMTWARWMGKQLHHVAMDRVGNYRVSTIFLGLDHQYGDGPPILWETMIFNRMDDELDQLQTRCSGSREQAEAMHATALEMVREKMLKKIEK